MRSRFCRLLVCMLVSVLSTAIASCGGSREGLKGDVSDQFGAPPNELTLKEKYRLDIQLPMDEAEFLDLLRKLNLRYAVFGEKTGVIPRAEWSTTIDLSRAKKYYQIYGERNVRERTAEVYYAYVDDDARVFYVENAFAYSIP